MKGPEAFRTISEAAAELGVPQHVLRFWETKFSFIRPMKRAGGRRFYRRQDLDLLKGVRTLLHDEGYTIKGVQRLHKEMGVRRLLAAGGPVDPLALAALEAPEALEPQDAPEAPQAMADAEASRAGLDPTPEDAPAETLEPQVALPAPEPGPESAEPQPQGHHDLAPAGPPEAFTLQPELWDEEDRAADAELEFAPPPEAAPAAPAPRMVAIRSGAREADAAASLEILRASARPPGSGASSGPSSGLSSGTSPGASPVSSPGGAQDLFGGSAGPRHVLDAQARARLHSVLTDLEGVKARLDRVISPVPDA